jgi:hypothetical protein
MLSFSSAAAGHALHSLDELKRGQGRGQFLGRRHVAGDPAPALGGRKWRRGEGEARAVYLSCGWVFRSC